MTDFDFDCAQKKRIARGAFNRKGTTNRKGCRLPHENLSKKELNKLNGEVMTLRLNDKLTWDEFKALSIENQTEYLQHKLDMFCVGINPVGTDLFGLSSNVLTNYVHRHGICLTYRYGGRVSNAAKESWKRWLNSERKTAPETETAQTPAEKYRAETQITHCEEPAKKENVKPFRAHDYPTRERGPELDEALAEAGLERDSLTEDRPKRTFPTDKLDITFTGTPVEILATLLQMFPTVLAEDRRYRFRVSADTFVLRDAVGHKEP